MKQWENQMSEKFRDAFSSREAQNKDKSITTAASIDLREQKGSYVLRLGLPKRDLEAVQIKWQDNALHILAPAKDGLGQYEQTIAMPGVESTVQLGIERRKEDQMIVVTVPKSSENRAETPPPSIADPSLAPLTDWDRNILGQMEKMSREMDRVFNESFREFKYAPAYKGFFDQESFGSSLDFREEGDNYIVSAYLPERDIKNVNVTVKDRVLTIDARAEGGDKRDSDEKGVTTSKKEQFSQLFTLPGPVQADKMKVEKKESMLVVTLPKAR